MAGWWNARAASVLCEGLAVWAQRTRDGRPIDAWVQAAHTNLGAVLDLLLGKPPRLATPDQYWYYALAGGLTGAVIRRFGWAAYLRLYGDSRITRGNLPRYFRRHFGVELGAVVRDWLADVADRAFGRITNHRLG